MDTIKGGTDHRDQPVYWFAILEIARDRGDSEKAAEAIRQLRRLGVAVTYKPRKRERVTV